MRRLPDGIARWLPGIILVVVALNQLRLAHTHQLSPWSGGGFGMFSTTDSPARRHIHAFLDADGIRRELVIPPELAEDARRAAALPTRDRLRRFTDRVAGSELDGPIRWQSIEIQVWGTRFDTDPALPDGVLIVRESFRVER
jgi:hypothetical protein